jgi:hypothetical protein
MKRLKWLFRLSLISSIVCGSSLVLYFTWSIDLTLTKQSMLVGITVTAIVLYFVSFTHWKSRIRHIKKALETFDMEDK